MDAEDGLTRVPVYTLRPYQREAVDAAFRWCASYEGNPLLILPTGAGKSLTMGAIIADAIANAPGTRALVLAHRKELISQNMRAVASVLPLASIGVYSAGLKRRDRDHQVIIAGIQSIGRDPHAIGAFDLILIDEAHLVPPADDTLYRKFIKAARIQNPDVRFIGLTATAYRLGAGLLHRSKGALFTDVAYEAPVRELVDAGYLCRLISKATIEQLGTAGVGTRGGEYVQRELEAAVDRDALTAPIIAETLALAHDRHHVLVFCAGVQHAEHVAAAFVAAGVTAAAVHGELDAETRAHRLAAFDDGRLRVVTSMDVLTTGFDQPKIDCIVLLRPTKSTGLYVQMVGRGFRLHPSKENTLVLDFAGIVALHGPVDQIRVEDAAASKGEGAAPTKTCPECAEIVYAGVMLCGACGFAFPPPERPPILPTASLAPILSDEAVPATWHDVTEVVYAFHEAKAPKIVPTLRVEYHAGFRRVASEWVCIEHTGFARSKAEGWWRGRSVDACPDTIEDALTLTHALRAPTRIATRPDGKYTRVVDYEFAPLPGAIPKACTTCRHFVEGMFVGEAAMCTKWDAEPPADVIAGGCEGWAVGEMQAANARADACLRDEEDDGLLPF